MPIRVVTGCKSLFDCLAKDASVPEDRGTALTVASLRESSAKVGGDTQRSGLKRVPTRVQLANGLTKSSAGVLRHAEISGTAQLHEESNKILRRKQLHGRAKRFETTQLRLSILSRKVRGSEDTTHGSTTQDPPQSTCSPPDYIQPSTATSLSTCHFPTGHC